MKSKLTCLLLHLTHNWLHLSIYVRLLLCIGISWLCILGYVILSNTKPSVPIIYKNTTPSMPIGYYITTLKPSVAYRYGDAMIIKAPQSIPLLSITKDKTNLVKTLRGKEGDKYVVTHDYLYIHGKAYPIFYENKKMNIPKLPHIPPGTYIVPKGYSLFLNDYYLSLDSRYLGPISNQNIVTTCTLLISKDTLERWWQYVQTEKKIFSLSS